MICSLNMYEKFNCPLYYEPQVSPTTFLNRVHGHLECFKNSSLMTRCTYLRNIDKLCDDFCPLLGGWFAQNHQLDPLRDSIK